jgi:eukaryotic-like serine/threonine-protein kinase
MLLFGISDAPASVVGAVEACPECGGAARIDGGACVSCLLRGGLDPSSGAESKTCPERSEAKSNGDPEEVTEDLTNESWDELLGQIDIRDNDWRLGNYQILDEIGRGGMGVIYRARQRHSRRIVALKRVLSYHSESRETLQRFRREAEAAASLDHPNILPIYEVGEADDLPFFTMKFATGGSLQKLAPILRESPRECVRLVMKITRAVACAHGEGILHRDLKPGNILLDARGEPLVSDFGLAKWLDGTSDLTRTLTIFGTPGYIAPEQAHSAATDLTSAADIYSLGDILFDLLAGQPPFLGEHALAVIKRADERPAPRLRSLVPRADRDLETICARCLERDPAARYQSASDLAEDLQRWLEGRPIKARAVSPPVRLWRWSKRNPLVATSLATIFIILLAATAISLRERQAALNDNKELQRTLQSASRADHQAARERFAAGAWREGLSLMGPSLTFWPENREAANYLLSAILFGQGDRDKLPIFGVYHDAPIIEPAFSPDGHYFATASADHTTRIWDAANGARIDTLNQRAN